MNKYINKQRLVLKKLLIIQQKQTTRHIVCELIKEKYENPLSYFIPFNRKYENTIKHTLYSWQGDKWEMLSLLNINVKLMIIKLIIKKLYFVLNLTIPWLYNTCKIQGTWECTASTTQNIITEKVKGI